MALIRNAHKMRLMILLAMSLTMTGCASQKQVTLTWPEKLEAVKLSDGGMCFSPGAVKRLNDFKLQIEALQLY